MALLPISKYFVFNRELKTIAEFIPSENEGGIYEVIRVIKGIPLFTEEHLKRFYHSAQIAQKHIAFSSGEIISVLNCLIQKNEISEGNIIISCKNNLKAFFIPHNYPTKEQYKNGVVCGIMKAERENPNAKVFQTNVRQQANRIIAENDFYEVLLVDHFGRITEGSRSNIFFIKEKQIITPPENEVLLGITRQKTIMCATSMGYDVQEEDVVLNDLNTYDAAFITGTSPKILPVKKVCGVNFNVRNRILLDLIKSFDQLIERYIISK